METPSSTRRVTRSQTQGSSMATNNIPTSNFEKGLSNSRATARKGSQQQDRSVLFDITNDSPIVGLKTASLVTPLSSAVGKSSAAAKKTPGSGEALLRGQVKTLLQKVEEEAELSKLSFEARSFVHNIKGMLVNSPVGLLAPTPANTPQVLSLSGGLASLPPSPLVEEMIISQVIEEKEHQEGSSLESQRSIITRSLLEDFSEKSDSYDSSSECLSILTDLEVASGEENLSADDDSASVWSVQVNGSARSEEEVEEEERCYDSELAEQARRHTRFVYDSDDEIVNVEGEEEEEDYYYEGIEEEEESEVVDELCEFISKISMDEKKKKKKKELPECEGKHVRFVYGSDDEIVKEDPVLHLKGLPTPKGEHLRFSEE